MFRLIRRSGLLIVASLTLLLSLVVVVPPAGAADITITAGSGDLPINQVILDDNGTTVTQNASQGTTNDNDDDPVDIVSITVDDGGTSVTLDQFNTASISTSNYNFPGTLTGVGTWENGTQTMVNTAGFQAAVDRVLGSLDLRDYLAYDVLNMPGTGWNPDFDMRFESPLRNSDYLLVSERLGNTFFDLVALDKAGNVIPGGLVVGFDAAYRWNTGYAPSNQPTQPMWFTVIDIAQFGLDTEDTPIYGFRIDNDGEADVKFFGLSDDPFEPAMELEKTIYAGHDSGVGCATSGELATVTTGAAVTYCFEVTNAGEADLDSLVIDDADLGLTAAPLSSFTVVSGSLPLAEGSSIVLAYETTATATVTNTATATADVLLSGGGVNTVLSPETATDTARVETTTPAPGSASISGKVVDDVGNPIAGVTLTLSGDGTGTTTTAADGTYSFAGLAAGTYTVTETQPVGYSDGPDFVGSTGGSNAVNDVISGIVLAGVDSVDNDFTEVAASIAGTVVDQDGNGISGVTITLSGTNDAGDPVSLSTTTDADGNYSFTGLLSGTYTLTETQPAGFDDGPDTAGSTGGTVSNDVIADIVLGVGVDSVDNDFSELADELADTGSETPLVVAFGFLFIVSGAILTLTASQFGPRRL